MKKFLTGLMAIFLLEKTINLTNLQKKNWNRLEKRLINTWKLFLCFIKIQNQLKMWKSYIKPKTMKKITTFCLTALFIFALSSCKNEPVKNKKETEPDRLKIVSLTPSITKQLNLLEVQGFVVGHTSYCPAKNLDSSEVVASATEVNIEKIATIKPDVVLVSTLTKQKVVKTLRKLNIKVKYLDMPGSFNEICSQLIKIGNIVNRKEEAEGIVKKQRTKLDSIRAKIPAGDTLKYFIEI